MTAKEYLIQYGLIKSRLRATETIIREIREELTGLGGGTIRSAWPDGQPHGTGTTDPTGNQAAAAADTMAEERREQLRRQLMDLEVREIRARSELWRQRMDIENTISNVKDPIHQDLLRMRYVEGKTFELIAVELCYSWRHTIRIHGEALSEVDKILRRLKMS